MAQSIHATVVAEFGDRNSEESFGIETSRGEDMEGAIVEVTTEDIELVGIWTQRQDTETPDGLTST